MSVKQITRIQFYEISGAVQSRELQYKCISEKVSFKISSTSPATCRQYRQKVAFDKLLVWKSYTRSNSSDYQSVFSYSAFLWWLICLVTWLIALATCVAPCVTYLTVALSISQCCQTTWVQSQSIDCPATLTVCSQSSHTLKRYLYCRPTLLSLKLLIC